MQGATRGRGGGRGATRGVRSAPPVNANPRPSANARINRVRDIDRPANARAPVNVGPDHNQNLVMTVGASGDRVVARQDAAARHAVGQLGMQTPKVADRGGGGVGAVPFKLFEGCHGKRGSRSQQDPTDPNFQVDPSKHPVFSKFGDLIFDPSKQCVCLRPLKRVCCRLCGNYLEGRVRKQCGAHPRDIYLLDVSQCPKCKANPLHLQEFDFSKGHQPLQKNRIVP